MKKNQSQFVELSQRVVKLQASVLAFVFAVIGGMGLFLMTAFLLMKGGINVGSHLQLLGQYLIGYSVTWAGSLMGLLYGSVLGWVAGWSIAILYNLIARARLRSSKGQEK